jgi:hypothetical protein
MELKKKLQKIFRPKDTDTIFRTNSYKKRILNKNKAFPVLGKLNLRILLFYQPFLPFIVFMQIITLNTEFKFCTQYRNLESIF